MDYCCCLVASVVSICIRPYGLQPARLLCPWDSLGKITGVGCHALLTKYYYSVIKKPCNLQQHGWTWRALCLVTEKDKCCMIMYTWSHKKKSEYNKKEILTDIENKLAVISGKGRGRGNIGMGIKRYKLPCINKSATRTGNTAQGI